MVCEDQGSGTGSSLTPVDRDEVDCPSARRHMSCKVLPERQFTDSRFDSNRQTCFSRDRLREIEQAVSVVELTVCPWTGTVLFEWNTSDCRDLRRNLLAGKKTTNPRLRPLAQLDLDGPHAGVPLDTILKTRHAESA